MGVLKKKYGFKPIAAFLLGLSTSLYVIYIGIIGSTTIRFDIAISIILFVLLFLSKNSIRELKLYFERSIVMFFIIMFFTSINASIYFINSGYIVRYFKAIVLFMVSLMTYSNVILLKDNKKFIINGMLFGLILNIGVSILQYITFKSGNYFSLYSIFPQPSFYIPIYNFRTQGLFLEPSHMLQFVISTILLFLVCRKPGISKTVTLIFLIFILLLSKSSNIVILILFLMLNYALKRKSKLRFKVGSLFLFMIVLIILTLNLDVVYNYIIKLDVLGLMAIAFNGINPNYSGNFDRVNGMLFSLNLIKQYPFGIGYGMSKTLFDKYGVAITSFNYLLTLQLEMGIMGVIIYLVRLYRIGFKLIRNRINNYQIALGLSIIASEMCAILNGGYFGNALWILYGLASIEICSSKAIKYSQS